MAAAKTVVVTGDLIWDCNLVQQPRSPSYHHEAMPPTVLKAAAGGAWYLADLVKIACGDMSPAPNIVTPPRPLEADPLGGCNVRQAYQLWWRHDKVRDGGAKAKVWRIGQFMGCPPLSKKAEAARKVPRVSPDAGDPAVLVLDDLCLDFRGADGTGAWPKSLTEGRPGAVIVKSSSAPVRGKFWERLLEGHGDRLTVVVSVAALRARGAAISRALSWDRAIEETAAEFEGGPSSRDLALCRRVVVHFGSDGAAVFTRSRSEARAELEKFLYHPRDLEDAWEAGRPGRTFGSKSILTAAMVRHELDPAAYPLFIALGRALAAMRAAHECGGGEGKELDNAAAMAVVGLCLHPPADPKTKEVDAEPAGDFYTAFPHVILADEVLRKQPARQSDLLRDVTGAGEEYVAAKAAEVVICGPDLALGMVPKAKYGRLLTVDREEIERIGAVRNLILEYQASAEDRRPLSLAVFGPPGSGKSFAIKEVASELFGARKAILEFNLSQMNGVEDLHAAFQRVRDASVYGQVPLVFWDEFDAEGLKWLKYFLVPMQDARFHAGTGEHPFGKAIFVFAGGTAYSMECFGKTPDGQPRKEFDEQKGPDFKSRLRGYINLKGLEPLLEGKCAAEGPLSAEQWGQARRDDPAYLIRRAIVLRAALEWPDRQLIDSKTGMAAVSAGVVRGFLRVKRFLHGARSVAALVSMSAVGSGRCLGPSELPSEDLLRLHVSDDLMEEVRQGELEVGVIEKLAEACHQAWYEVRWEEGWRYASEPDYKKKLRPLMTEYPKLQEPDKERNRLTARVTRAKLLSVGLALKREQEAGPGPHATLSGDDRKRLMEIEHDIWLRDHLLKGYEWAGTTEEHVRRHRDMAPFAKVPPEDKKIDRAIVEKIPGVLKDSGYVLVREGPKQGGGGPRVPG